MAIEIDTTQFNIPPGKTLKEQIRYLGMSQKELSERMGITEKAVSHIITGKVAVSLDTALKLETILGIDADFWLNLEANYQINKAKNTETIIDNTELELAKLYTCYKFLVRRNLVQSSRNYVVRVRELRSFFGVSNLAYISKLDYGAAFRKSDYKELDRNALSILLRIGEIEANEMLVGNYDAILLKQSLKEIKKLTRLDLSVALKELKNLFDRAGLKIVYTPFIPNTMVNGVVKWMGSTPVIQMTDFRKSADIFWFTLFHELGHVLLHANKKTRYVDSYDIKVDSQEEQEADNFAQNELIPKEQYALFLKEGNFFEAAINRFAKKIGISPDIVAGRLAYDRQVDSFGFEFAHKYRRALDFEVVL